MADCADVWTGTWSGRLLIGPILLPAQMLVVDAGGVVRRGQRCEDLLEAARATELLCLVDRFD